MFEPALNILPPAQRVLWPELMEVPRQFVLYGGTGLALRLGHRESNDFDFFSSARFEHADLLTLNLLKRAKVLQSSTQTLVVTVDRSQPVKLSFFGGLSIGRVDEPTLTPDRVIYVAALLDLAGTKAAVITQRAEVKDYLDLLELARSGVSLAQGMAAARALYGEQYNPLLTLKSLTYFGDGDLHRLSAAQKQALVQLASANSYELPDIRRVSDALSTH